jgi:hypothetical protein
VLFKGAARYAALRGKLVYALLPAWVGLQQGHRLFHVPWKRRHSILLPSE